MDKFTDRALRWDNFYMMTKGRGVLSKIAHLVDTGEELKLSYPQDATHSESLMYRAIKDLLNNELPQ